MFSGVGVFGLGKEKLSETGPNMSEILANYMIFIAWKYTFICAFFVLMVCYCIENEG